MTSNMGAETILENFDDLEAVGDKHRTEILETTKLELLENLKDNLRPEFLNRIDEKIMFLPLTQEEIKQILRLLLKDVKKMLNKQHLKLEISEEALDLLADLGYEPQFGARPMKRVLQKELINPLSKKVIAGDLDTGDTIIVETNKEGLVFTVKKEVQETAEQV